MKYLLSMEIVGEDTILTFYNDVTNTIDKVIVAKGAKINSKTVEMVA